MHGRQHHFAFLFGPLLALSLLSSGCYVVEQGYHVLAYQARARKVERILEESDDRELREFLLLARRIKRYAVDSLGLAEDRNYTTYVETGRPYMVDVVSAAQADTFEQHRWCYPVVGCVPYKGFFDPDDATRLARRLEDRGLDVYRWQAGAFSTLGILTDPLLSHMRRYSVFGLASLIIHEQTHATIYLKGQAQFNEELATFVGTEGALRFVADTYGDSSQEYRAALQRLEDRRALRAFNGSLYAKLDSLYSSETDTDVILRKKKALIDSSKQRFLRTYSGHFGADRAERFLEKDINNAYLCVQHTYSRDLDLYYRVYAANGGDLRRTFEAILGAGDHPDDPKGYLRSMVLGRTPDDGEAAGRSLADEKRGTESE